MTIAVAPFSFQSGQVEPYISMVELLASATAAAVDFGHLIENGTDEQQTAATQELIWRASAIADLYTLGRSGNTVGTLNATLNKEGQWNTPKRDGNVIIHPAFIPIVALTAFGFGSGPQTVNVPISNDNVIFDEEQFIITNAGPLAGVTAYGNLNQIFGGLTNRRVWCTYSYICGYANSFTLADYVVGTEEILVTDPTGMQPGQPMMLWDAENNEQTFIASTYNGVSSTIPLASPTQFAHVSGTNFSAIPPAVKQACIHLVCALVKERAQGGVVLETSGGMGGATISKSDATNQDYSDAFDLLDDFKPTWGKL
jgi:hypothetical protein